MAPLHSPPIHPPSQHSNINKCISHQGHRARWIKTEDQGCGSSAAGWRRSYSWGSSMLVIIHYRDRFINLINRELKPTYILFEMETLTHHTGTAFRCQRWHDSSQSCYPSSRYAWSSKVGWGEVLSNLDSWAGRSLGAQTRCLKFFQCCMMNQRDFGFGAVHHVKVSGIMFSPARNAAEER